MKILKSSVYPEGSEERFRKILDSINEVVYSVSATGDNLFGGTVEFVSPQTEQIVGYRPEEFMQDPGLWFGIIHPDDHQELATSTQRICSSRKPGVRTYRMRHKETKEYLWMEDKVLPQVDDAGRLIGILGVARDITERKLAEEQLRESQKKLEAILETVPSLIVLMDSETRLLLFNRACEELSGYQRQEVLGRTLLEVLVPPEWGAKIQEKVSDPNAPAVRGIYANPWTTKSGEQRMIEWNCVTLSCPKESGPLVLATGTDITDRHRSEKEIKRRTEELAAINTITAAVSNSLDLPEILETSRGILSRKVGIPGGAILYYDEANDWLDLKIAWGLPPAMLDKFRKFPVTGFHNERVIREKAAVLTPDFREIKSFQGTDLDTDPRQWQSYLCLPLLAENEVQGILCLFSSAPTVFSESQVDFLKALGQPLGIAIYNARLFEQVRNARERLQAVSRRLVQIQEEERRSVARELHDEVGQILTGLKLTLDDIQPAGDHSAANLDRSQALVRDLMDRIRDLSLDLRPSMLDDLGLAGTLPWYFDRYTSQTKVQVTFKQTNLSVPLSAELKITAYRIVQEGLTNVARHAHVDEVTVRVWANKIMLGIQIQDQGCGFDPATVSERYPSRGLAGMRERAMLLGGRFSVESAPGGGTCLTVELPRNGRLDRGMGTKQRKG